MEIEEIWRWLNIISLSTFSFSLFQKVLLPFGGKALPLRLLTAISSRIES